MAKGPGSNQEDKVGSDPLNPAGLISTPVGPARKPMTVLERVIAQGVSGIKEYGDSFDPARHDFPLLWKAITSTEAGPDHTKEPGKIAIKCTPGGIFVSLSDDCFGFSIDAPCEHLGEAFEALEKELNKSQPAIRYWPNHEPKARKKRKV